MSPITLKWFSSISQVNAYKDLLAAPRLITARTPRDWARSCGGGAAVEINVPPRASTADELLRVTVPTISGTRSTS